MFTNFKEFFQDNYFRLDRKYVDIAMPKRNFQEMAVPMDIAKHPIKPDEDDIEFLKQFPPNVWSQALHQRYYHDLADALEERESRRKPVNERLFKIIKKALETGNPAPLQGVVSDELFYRLQNGEYEHVSGDDELIDRAAKNLAEMETEKAAPHANHPKQEDGMPGGFKKYTFNNGRGEKQTFVAKPFINRLIHKLERTRGHEHHPESGLSKFGHTHGQYGYDLHGLQRGDDLHPHSTRGMQLPIPQEIAARMSDYLNHNAHGMYGTGNDFTGDDIVWKPVTGGKMGYKDNWSWRKVYNKLFPKMVARLTTAEPGSIQMPNGDRVPPERGFGTVAQRRAAAHKLAMAEIFRMAESGELRGAPIPGIAPQGLPVKVKTGGNGEKKIDAPPLYLPHKKGQPVRVVKNGQVETETHDIPLIKPGEYLRQLGTEEGDEEIDPSELRGHQKDYVAVPHNSYRKAKGYVAGGAFHVTHNSAGRQHLDPSDPEYQDRKQEIESEMGLVGLDERNRASNSGEGQYFGDIIKGIWNCINSACGGMTASEVAIMKDNVHDLHQLVYQKMMMNLRDSKLDTPAGRRKFATNIASSWAQQDLGRGGGTRRLRRLNNDGRDASMDADTENETGQSMSLRDSIQSKMKNATASDGAADAVARQQGEKARPVGKHEFSYNLDNYRQMLKDLETQAVKVDQTREQAVSMSKGEISDQIATLLGDAMTDKAALVFQLQFYLKQLYMSSGSPEAEAETLALNKVESYSLNRANAKNIVAAFRADREVQAMLGGNEQEPQMSQAQKDALDRLKGILDQMETGGKLQDAEAQSRIYAYINSPAVPDEAKQLAKAEADKRFGRTPAPAKAPAAAAAPVADPRKVAIESLNTQIRNKEYMKVARNPLFWQQASAQKIQQLISILQQTHQGMQDGFDKDEHDFAISHLQHVLANKNARIGKIS